MSASKDPCTGSVFDLAIPTPKRARKRVNAFIARPDAKTMAENTMLAMPMMGGRRYRSASQPIGTAPEHEEPAGCGADEDDDAVADAEGVADVRRQDGERGRLQLLEGGEQEEDDEGERATDAQAGSQRQRFGPDAGEQLVGEEDLRGFLLGLPLGLRVEHRVGERGRLRHRLRGAHVELPRRPQPHIGLPLDPAPDAIRIEFSQL